MAYDNYTRAKESLNLQLFLQKAKGKAIDTYVTRQEAPGI